jgi:ABC-type branched-subunit amino acid transport system substrate-binding protein
VTRICMIDLTSGSDPDLLSANLTIAIIDDLTGAITSAPYPSADGALNVGDLIRLNRQVIEQIHKTAHQDEYFGGLTLPKTIVSNVSDEINGLSQNVKNLRQLLDTTLSQDSWMRVREGLLHSLINIPPNEAIRLVIRTENLELQALPIERTSFIINILGGTNRSMSVVFAPKNPPNKLSWDSLPKILLILGDQKNIEKPIELSEIEKHVLAHGIVTPLYTPSPEVILKKISDEKFDIIIMVGHSHINSEGTDGRISINDRDSISIDEFTHAFKSSVNRGLKLVILAGCSSIGAARALASTKIGVPNVIAFRVPVHYKVLRLFFDRLLSHWIDRSESLEVALTNTRGYLSVYDRECPGASILPILFTSPYDPPLKFPKHRSIWEKISHVATFPALGSIQVPGRNIKIPPIVSIGLIAGSILLLRSIFIAPKLEAACNNIPDDGISCGEEILLPKPSSGQQIEKQAGANAIARGEYAQAVELLTKAWDADKDPETLIMLENAKLSGKNIPIKSIALSIPGFNSTPNNVVPTAMLKAIAFAQQQWNVDSHSWKLQVVLVDDRNDKVYAKGLLHRLLKRSILAGIGSYSSVVTLPAKDIYQNHHTVLISGTATSNLLTNRNIGNFFFRTCANNDISAQQIADYLTSHNYTKIALFRTIGKAFSGSMTTTLKAKIQGISIVKEFDFKADVSATDYLDRAKAAGAQAIVLIPDAYTSDNPERDRLISIIKENNGELPIIGNEVVKDPDLFNFSKKQIQNLIIALSWHPSSSQNESIDLPNWWGDRSQLDHRIAMNYDAVQVLIQGLNKLPIDLEINDGRKQLQKIISAPNFSINGLTGEIQFKGSDRSQSTNSLIRPKCNDTKCAGFEPAL